MTKNHPRGRLLAAHLLIVSLIGSIVPDTSHALVDDIFTSLTQPANALLMPFDATAGHASYLLVSNVHGISSSGVGQVSTHWSFWSDGCDHLADVSICLTLNDSVVVDPASVIGRDASNQPVGQPVDLSGQRGFVSVTAYATDASCSDASAEDFTLVDDAIVGTATIASTATGSAFGNDAIGLGVNPSGIFTDLPDNVLLSPNARAGSLDIQTFSPETLEDSRVIFIAVQENAGKLPGEVGPLGTAVSANLNFIDTLEINTSLPDLSFTCTKFASLLPSASDALIPPSVSMLSSGVLRLTNIRSNAKPIGDADGVDGNDNWVYGLHGQAVGQFGGSSNGKYRFTELGSVPTPAPTRTPLPTSTAPSNPPTPSPTGNPVSSPTPTAGGATPTPAGGTPTPAGATPTPGGPTPTAGGATPTPGGSTPTPGVATPTPTAGGTSCNTVTVTVSVSYNTTDFPSVSGVQVGVNYPGAAINIPGTGNDSSVLGRVDNLTGIGGLFSAGDQDADPNASQLNIGLISISSTIPPGNFARAHFDCTVGQSAPSKSAFSCTVSGSTLTGGNLDAQCSIMVSIQ